MSSEVFSESRSHDGADSSGSHPYHCEFIAPFPRLLLTKLLYLGLVGMVINLSIGVLDIHCKSFTKETVASKNRCSPHARQSAGLPGGGEFVVANLGEGEVRAAIDHAMRIMCAFVCLFDCLI